MYRASRGIEPATGPDNSDTHALSLDASVRGSCENRSTGDRRRAPEGKSKHGSDTMGKVLDEDLVYEILSVVAEIPAGCVASYGQIARLIGREKLSPGRSGAERGGSLRRLSLPPRRQPRGTPRAKLPRPASTTDGGRSRLPRQRLRRHEKAPVERVARQRSVERSDATERPAPRRRTTYGKVTRPTKSGAPVRDTTAT